MGETYTYFNTAPESGSSFLVIFCKVIHICLKMYCIHRQYRRWSTSKNVFLKGHQGAIAVVTKKLRSVLIFTQSSICSFISVIQSVSERRFFQDVLIVKPISGLQNGTSHTITVATFIFYTITTFCSFVFIIMLYFFQNLHMDKYIRSAHLS